MGAGGRARHSWPMVLMLAACVPSTSESGARQVVNEPPVSETIVRAVELLRLGSRDGAGPEVFGRVSFVVADGLGRLYVGDGMAQEIRVFDDGGRFLRSFGQAGEGPGEFLDMLGLAFDATGTAWVWDGRQQRLTAFDTAGTFVRSVQRPWRSTLSPWPGLFADDGSLFDVMVDHRGLTPGQGVTRRFESAVRGYRFDSQLQLRDSLPALVALRTAFAGNHVVPFEGGVVWAFEADGASWFTHGPRYRIARTNAQGDTVLVFTVDVPEVPVTEAEVDSALSAYRLPRGVSAMDEALIPGAKPAIVRLVRLEGGWVGAFPELGPATGRYMDVFTPEGVLRARVDLGSAVALRGPAPYGKDGRLFGVVRDEMDVQYVVAFDLGIPEMRE